jgi:hypothetical protein
MLNAASPQRHQSLAKGISSLSLIAKLKKTMDASLPYAALALSLTAPGWTELGLDSYTAPSEDVEEMIDRITALFLIRTVAVASFSGEYPDHSTSSICRTALMQDRTWPASVTPAVLAELRQFVSVMFKGYNQVPYHNFKHAYHVTLSMNKLIDLMWPVGKTVSYGLRQDPLMLLALLFSAIIHDVEHRGVPNRQLATEDDDLAVLYNDQSIAEQRSLYLGFKEFLSPSYKSIRHLLFPEKNDYRRFRVQVVNLVLNTDIASPAITQLAKSKWNEAFGDPTMRERDQSEESDEDHDAFLEDEYGHEEHDEDPSMVSIDEDNMLAHVQANSTRSLVAGVRIYLFRFSCKQAQRTLTLYYW